MPEHRHSGPQKMTSNVDPSNYEKVPITIDKQDIAAYGQQKGKLVRYSGKLKYFRGFVGAPVQKEDGSVDGSRYEGHLLFEDVPEGTAFDAEEVVTMYKTKPPEAEEVKARKR